MPVAGRLAGKPDLVGRIFLERALLPGPVGHQALLLAGNADVEDLAKAHGARGLGDGVGPDAQRVW
jgi:hypothetical protein